MLTEYLKSEFRTAVHQQWDKMEERGDLKIDLEADYIRLYNNHQQTEGKES